MIFEYIRMFKGYIHSLNIFSISISILGDLIGYTFQALVTFKPNRTLIENITISSRRIKSSKYYLPETDIIGCKEQIKTSIAGPQFASTPVAIFSSGTLTQSRTCRKRVSQLLLIIVHPWYFALTISVISFRTVEFFKNLIPHRPIR